MTLIFNRLVEVVKIHVRAKSHQAKCSGSRVIVFTIFWRYWNNTAVASADCKKLMQQQPNDVPRSWSGSAWVNVCIYVASTRAIKPKQNWNKIACKTCVFALVQFRFYRMRRGCALPPVAWSSSWWVNSRWERTQRRRGRRRQPAERTWSCCWCLRKEHQMRICHPTSPATA